MSSIKVEVLYKGKEVSIDMEINEDNLYNSFLDIFRQKFSENDPLRDKFKLIAINTNIPYLLIDEDNIANIIKEKIPNDAPLKMLLIKEENLEEEIKKDSLDDNFFCGYFKEGMDDEEDFNDDDFMILDNNIKDEEKETNEKENENKKEKEEEEKMNKILTNSLSKENDKNNEYSKNENNINEIKEEEKKNIENENDIENLNFSENLRLSRLSSSSGNININSMIIEDNKKKDEEINRIKNNDDENNINNNYSLPVKDLNLPKNIFNSEVCTLCNKTLSSFKYICSICENCNLCEKCEDIHIHPCFKYKTMFLSNLPDTYKYIDRNYNYKIPIDSKKMTKLIRKEYNLKIVPMTDLQFSLRPNKIIDIPVKILNLSDHEINSSQFIVLIKNNKLININYEVDNIFSIKPHDEYELKLLCRTSTSYSKEKINIEIYSAELKIRMSSRLNFDLEIEINEDKQDDELNKKLNNDKYAILHTKQHKDIILCMIYFKDKWKNDLKKLCQVLRDNKWDTKKSIEDLNKEIK